MKLAALIVGVAIAVSLAWLAGEQHRKNCIHEGKRECSVLPWESGRSAGGPSGRNRDCADLPPAERVLCRQEQRNDGSGFPRGGEGFGGDDF
jgi:hypothetical protein